MKMPKPIGFLTNESSYRLSCGGNDSRGTVPLHKDGSNVAKHPVYSFKEVQKLIIEVERLENQINPVT